MTATVAAIVVAAPIIIFVGLFISIMIDESKIMTILGALASVLGVAALVVVTVMSTNSVGKPGPTVNLGDPSAEASQSASPSTYTNKYGYEMDLSSMRPVTGVTASGRIVPCMAEVDDNGKMVNAGDLDCDWSRATQMQSNTDPRLILAMMKVQDLTYLPFNKAGLAETADVTDCLSTDKSIVEKINSGKWADAARTVSCYDGEDITRITNTDSLTEDDINGILAGKGVPETKATDEPQSAKATQSADSAQSSASTSADPTSKPSPSATPSIPRNQVK